MPSYKTHSIHGEMILPEMNLMTDINKEDLKTFCIGPDTLMATNYTIFKRQHRENVRDYYLYLLDLIKKNKLQDNKETMAFLYGQLCHFVLDVITHPLIIYMTEGLPKEHLLDHHGLVEHYLDDYVMKKFNIPSGPYYHKLVNKEKKLLKVINELYEKVFQKKGVGLDYVTGIMAFRLYDLGARRDKTQIINAIIKGINLGDVSYHDNYDLARPFLNLDHEVWTNPETGEKYTDSFDDLWEKACEIALDIIEDVNMYLYHDRPLNNSLILDDISYNTALPCVLGQTKRFVKKI